MRKQLLPFLLFCCFLPNAQAQNYLPVARHFGIEDGLPHRQVNCILEDRRGFIWIATDGGVARFDGRRFKIFNKADNGLSTNLIEWMLEDAKGNLWLISEDSNGSNFTWGIGSVDILDPDSGLVIPLGQYIASPPPVPLKNLHIKGLRFTADKPGPNPVPDGALFFGTQNPGGWLNWHPDTGWRQVIAASIPELALLSITPRNGFLGVVFPESFHEIIVETDASGKVLNQFQGAGVNKFNTMYGGSKDPKGAYAREENPVGGQTIYWEKRPGDYRTLLTLPIPKPRSALWDRRLLLELESGKLWLTEHEIFNKKGEIILDLLAQFPTLNNRYIDRFFVDRKGGIWLSTGFSLEHIELRKDHFRRFLFDKNALAGRGIACRGIAQVDKYLWVNTEFPFGGRQRIDLETGQDFFFKQPDLSNYGLASDAAGNMWSGLNSNTISNQLLERIGPVSGQVLDAYPVKSQIPWYIFPAKPNQLWLGTYSGLMFFDPQTGQISRADAQNYPEFEKASIMYIGRDHLGNIWLCSSAGFYKMTAEGKIAGRFCNSSKGDHWLPYDNFYHFHEDAEGVFWLGTAGGGLLRWNPETGEKQLISRKNGLLNGFVYAVYEDDFGHLWLPTDFGIAQFDKKSLTVRRSWLPADGVAQNEFNRTSHFRGADGTLYFGGLNGVTAFNPKDFYQNEKGSAGKNLVLSDFKLFSGSSEKLENRSPDLLSTGKIIMEPDDRYFQLEFALLDYSAPDKITYAFKIEGVDDDWNILSEPLLRLSSLPCGTRRLTIRAQAADGSWAANELDYTLTVRRPIYLRWWFLLLAAAMVVAGSYYFYRFQLHRRLSEKESLRLQQLDTFKTRFFANISHEFRTPLTVILGMVASLKKHHLQSAHKEHDDAADMIHRNSRQLLNLVNQLLDLSRLEAGKLNLSPQNGDLVAFLRYEVESYHSYAESRQIKMHFDSEMPELPMAFDQEKIQAICANLLSNALKFTPEGGSVAVRLRNDAVRLRDHEREIQNRKSQIVIQVSDTGIGIPEDQLDYIFDRFHQVDNSMTRKEEGTGIGLALVHELVKLMQGDIAVESTVGKGASFRITLPYTPPQPQFETWTLAKASPQVSGASSLSAPQGSEASRDDKQLPLVLIVEDNADVRFYISQCVRQEYRVALAENGAEGIQKAIELIPDIIISDVMMPEKDGFELCETVKNDERTSHIPIVLLTARADVESRIAGLKRGADAYLAKPFEPAELLIHLDNLVRLRRKLQQRYAGMPQLPKPSEDPDFVLEDAFLLKIRALVETRMTESDLDMQELERAMGMSHSQIFRKVKALTGESPSVLIRSIRLQKAKELLLNSSLTIAEVAYEVGFSTPAYFSTTFLEAFGKTPSEWRKG